jgi:iron complex transport system ATP-binding protein
MGLELERVTFSYRGGPDILRDITVAFNEPGLVCIIGPNGVGKSTLIRCMNKILRPTKGTVLLNGEDISGMRYKEVSEHMGYVPVGSDDTFPMTVFDTVMMGRSPKHGRSTSKKDQDAVYDVLELMGIEDLAMRNFNELSAGQHQKVAIARGLVQQTRILILDEPTSNLDVRHQVYVTSFLKELSHRTGMTVVMISHDLNLAAKFADVVVLMEKPGRIHSVGAPKDVIVPDAIRDVYGVDCDVVDDQGSPHVMLHDVLRRSLGKDVAISVGHGA